MSSSTVAPVLPTTVLSAKPKSGIFGTVMKGLKKTFLGLIVVCLLWVLYGYGKNMLLKMFWPAQNEAKPEIKDFSPTDTVQYEPVLGTVNEVASDKTADALLSGSLGPAVVMFYAEWCSHCRNIEAAYQDAAKVSKVAFVKISGASAPVSSTKYAVNGYPTIFGVSSLGGLPSRFASARTAQSLTDFANLLVGVAPEAAAKPMQQAPTIVANAPVSTNVTYQVMPQYQLPQTIEVSHEKPLQPLALPAQALPVPLQAPLQAPQPPQQLQVPPHLDQVKPNEIAQTPPTRGKKQQQHQLVVS